MGINVYTSAVIGLGQIGMGYDYNIIDENIILTHAKSFKLHPGYQLISGVDTEENSRKLFERKYEAQAFCTLDEMYEQFNPSIIALSSPTYLHYRLLTNILAKRPMAVICEKPLEINYERSRLIAELSLKYKIPVLVNYFRRFEPGVVKLKALIDQSLLGSPISGIVWYSGGLVNNASHYIDLIQFLLGNISLIEVYRIGQKISPYDIEADFTIRAGTAEILFRSWRSDHYPLLVLDLLLSKGRIRYDLSGKKITFTTLNNDQIFLGKESLCNKDQVIENNFEKYQMYVAQALYDKLTIGKELISDVNTALIPSKIIDEIFSSKLYDKYR
jgi:predicted dehydrogenase